MRGIQDKLSATGDHSLDSGFVHAEAGGDIHWLELPDYGRQCCSLPASGLEGVELIVSTFRALAVR